MTNDSEQVDCDFSTPDGVCPRCGYKGRAGLRKNCRKAPTVARKAYSLAAASGRWIRAGRPRRSPERIAEVFEICQACPEFRPTDDANGTCNLCGCPLRQRGGLIDKISMATESCPADPQRWTAELP